jgi:hypothetical protein
MNAADDARKDFTYRFQVPRNGPEFTLCLMNYESGRVDTARAPRAPVNDINLRLAQFRGGTYLRLNALARVRNLHRPGLFSGLPKSI